MGAVSTILNALQTALPSFAKSDGSIEAKIIDVVGSYADSEAIERDNTLTTINTALTNQKVTRPSYYRKKAVAYQEGYTLSYDSVNQLAYYETTDEEAQIVKQAYIIGSFPSFTMIVNAIDDSTSHLRELTDDELTAFKAYFEEFQPLGMDITIITLPPAQISDDNMVIYVKAGVDLQTVLDNINANLIAYEATLRDNNLVTLSEIEDVIRQESSVLAVGWNDPTAYEELTDGTTRNTSPSLGVFELESGTFTFSTTLSLSNLTVLN